MVIKILKPSSTFHGIGYSEKKLEKSAERIYVKNFDDSSNLSQESLKKQLEQHTSLAKNKSIKNTQFHVSLSAKGRSLDKNELLDIGKEYMKYMGYENNPYVVYFHKDTANNHIHIVSSRVGVDGKKINDSFEKKRTENFIKNELGIDFKYNIVHEIDVLKKYKYSSSGQIGLLGEHYGLDINIKDDNISIYKSSELVDNFNISNFNIDPNLKNKYKDNVKQNRAIIYKYQKLIPGNELDNFLSEKFGLRVLYNKTRNYKINLTSRSFTIFNKNGSNEIFTLPDGVLDFKLSNDITHLFHLRDSLKDKNQRLFVSQVIKKIDPIVFGYNLIDEKSKLVFKGSDIMKLQKYKTENIVDNVFNKTVIEWKALKGIESLQDYLKQHNGVLDSNLDIKVDNNIISIDNDIKYKMLNKSISDKQKEYTLSDVDLNNILRTVSGEPIDMNDFLSNNGLEIVQNREGNPICINESEKSFSEVDKEFIEFGKTTLNTIGNSLGAMLALWAIHEEGEAFNIDNRKKRKRKK